MVLPSTDTLVGEVEVGVGRYEPRYAIPDPAGCHPRQCQQGYLVLRFLCVWDEGVVSTPRVQDKGVFQRDSVSWEFEVSG